MAEGQYTSNERVYLDKDGNRVDAKDPKRHTLAVAAGASIPMGEARRLGLVGGDEGDGAETDESPAGEAEGEEDAIDAQEESARVQGRAAKTSRKAGKKGK